VLVIERFRFARVSKRRPLNEGATKKECSVDLQDDD
jgi:hypothetical protein